MANGGVDKRPFGGARAITIAGVLTAMTVVTTMFTKIPISAIQGYFNLGDTMVLMAGVLFGSYTGAFAGAVGSALADIFTGAYIFAPITFIVKGAEGFAAGAISGGGLARGAGAEAGAGAGAGRKNRKLTLALIAGAAVMIVGYFVAEALVLSLFDRSFGLSAAVAELPFNMVQGGISVVIARVAAEGFKRSRII